MEFRFDHFQALFPASSTLAIIITLIFILVKGKKSRLRFSFIALLFTMFLWTFGQLLQYISGSMITTIFSIFFVQTSISFIALAWLFFVLVYTNHPIMFHYQKLLPLFIIPGLAWLALLTNGYHHLLFVSIHYAPKEPYNLAIEYGNLFWLFALISFFYSFAGLMILYQFSKHQIEPVNKQSMILWLAPIVILISTIWAFVYLWISRQTSPPFYGVEITPTLFTIMIVIFAVAIFRYRFLDILPGVLQKVIENIDDAVLIVDNNNYIASFNPSFASFFQRFAFISTNTPISAFTQSLKNHCAIGPDSTLILAAFESEIADLVEGDICLTQPERKYYKVQIRLLSNQKKVQGRIITFTDVTEYRRLLTELGEKNTELTAVNEQLQEHLKLVEELAGAKERNRIAQETHDTLGHTMTLLIALLEVSTIICEQNPAETKVKLQNATRVAKEGIKELRRSISQRTEIKDLFDSLQKLFADCNTSGLQVEFSVEGMKEYLHPKHASVIYRICQEALTNAVRHGKAKQATIILRFNGQTINLFIFDNGQGCQTITKGMGLTGMEERVKELKGTIEYGSSGESGFNINVEIPII